MMRELKLGIAYFIILFLELFNFLEYVFMEHY